MTLGNEIFQPIDRANRNGKAEHHGESGINGASDKIWRENRSVPARDNADREIEAHDRMNGEHQRRRESSEKQIGGLITMPVPGRITPAHREQSVNPPDKRILGAITHGSEVRNQADKPEHQRNREVSRNSEYVPNQRAAEVRPVPHGV